MSHAGEQQVPGPEVPTALNSAIYSGTVWHRRLTPRVHEFSYQVSMVYLDLAEIEAVFGQSRLWGQGSGASRLWPIVQFRRGDFFRDSEQPLDQAIRNWVEAKTGTRPQGPIRMLANLRTWGYIINPIVCYYLFDASGERLEYVIAEVTNTPWRERIQYLLKADASGGINGAEFDKEMYVSPFHELDMAYRWRSSAPGQQLTLAIDNLQGGEEVFNAAMTLERKPMTAGEQRALLWRHPWMTGKVALAIYWQALKLYVKRVPVVPHEDSIARSG